MRWGLVAAAITMLAGAALARVEPAQAASIGPVNGDFEAGAALRHPADGGTLTVGAGQPVHGGAAAGHVQSSAAAPVTIRTQYWLTPAVATRQYTLTVAVRIPAATMTSVTARLDLVTAAGAVLISNAKVQAGPTAGYVTISTTSVTAPAGTDHALVVLSGTPTAAGARFSVDNVVIDEVIPPPPPAPPPEPAIVAAPAAEAAPPEPPVATPIPRGVAVRFPSATATPAPRSKSLLNGSFDTGPAGWNVVQGRAWTDTWNPGQGPSLVLHTDTASTVWVEQTVNGIEPGAWYGASALLATNGAVDRGWLRVSWLDAPDGAGRTLGNDDAPSIGSRDPDERSVAPNYQVVGTSAVQAPLLAASASVRFLLQSSAAASLIIDNVTFAPTVDPSGATMPAEARPPAPSATPPAMSATTPRARATSTPATRAPGASTPRPTATARAAVPPAARATPTAATPPVVGGLRAEDLAAPGTSDAQRAFRVTQLLPDPAAPGRDTEYEWVEIANLGVVSASVEGMTLRDNSGTVTLPALVVPAGGSLVIVARLAEVSGVTAFRLPEGIGNGLGNSGDHLVLATADGRPVDAFSYGDDTTYLSGARIPVPGTGRAIERVFDAAGTYREARIVEQPTPGRTRAAAPAPAATAAGASTTPVEAGAATGAVGTWVVLLSLAGGLLGGAAVQRITTIGRERRG